MKNKKHRYRLIIIILVFLTVFAFSSPRIVLSRTRHYADSDFFSFWLASRMTWTGQNPFNPELWIDGHNIHGANWISDNTFLYPPGLSVILAPIGLLPLFEAYGLWVFLSLTFILISVIHILANWLDPSDHLYYLFPMIVGGLLFHPFIATLVHGQIGALIFLLLAVALSLFKNRIVFWGGLIIGLLTIKPNIGLPIISILGFFALIKQEWRLILGLFVGSFSILAISQFRVVGWLSQYIHILSEKGNQTIGFSPTLWGVTGLACNDDRSCVYISGFLLSASIIIFILTFINKNKDNLKIYVVELIALSTVLLITPYLWGYDLVLLMVIIFVLSMDMKKTGYPYLVTASLPLLFSLLSVLFTYIGSLMQRDTINTLLSLFAIVAVLWFYKIRPNKLSTENT